MSDLHIGRSPKHAVSAQAIHDAIIASGIDHVIATGDITEHGRESEYGQFMDIFGDLIAMDRLTMVPGNHDCLGDNIGKRLMDGPRVNVIRRPGIHLIRINSTGPHNRSLFRSHGIIDTGTIDTVERRIHEAGPDMLVVIALHHHLLPLPEDLWIEKVSTFLGLPYALELSKGKELIGRIHGACDLALHGHRHTSKETVLQGERPLHIYNAGSSTDLGRFRVFSHANGRIIGAPAWHDAGR